LADPRINPLANKKFVTNIFESERYLFARIVGINGIVVYDKSNGELNCATILYGEKEEKMFGKKEFTPYFITADNAALISYETPLLEDVDKEEENPVIVLLYLKS
jgi:hypothetical protein